MSRKGAAQLYSGTAGHGMMDASQQYGADEEQYGETSAPCGRLVDFSDEVLLIILDLLDPFSLFSMSRVCSTFYRVVNTDSLWAKKCRVAFGCSFRTGCAGVTPKEAFKLMYMWKKLYGTLPYNRKLQELLFSGSPLKKYWIQWLSLEEVVPLPPVQLPDHEIEDIWGITKDWLDETHKVPNESTEVVHYSEYKYDWNELHNMALVHKGSSNVQSHVIRKMSSERHEELEWLYYEHKKNRFQWIFSYWLFGLPKSCSKQLQKTYLWWKWHDKKKISPWGSDSCDIRYIASLHSITDDFWNGKLANGDEEKGIQSVRNYFSMCKSLLAWILGRKWGKFKQKKVYKEALKGVYLMLKYTLQVSVVNHGQFWSAAKLQMHRIYSLENIAGNYVNWNIIDVLPSYRMFMDTGNDIYLHDLKGFLFRKQLINNWIFKEENFWVCCLLPHSLFRLLKFDTKIYEGSLHGDKLEAQLSRLIWLYLHSGQQIFLDAMKVFVYEIAHAGYPYLPVYVHH